MAKATVTGLSRPSGSSRASGPSGSSQLPELKASWWESHSVALASVRFSAMARRLPAVLRQAVAIAWQANRRDTVAALALNLLAGVATAFGLLATRGVLQALFAAGPTLDRVRAAVPSLVVVAAATFVRSGLSIIAGWAQARLEPQVLTTAERRLFELTTQVKLAAFDDAGFSDEMERARNRGSLAVQFLTRGAIDLTAGLAGLAATAVTLALLHPVLLGALLLASVPAAWAAVRAARLAYLSNHARTSRRRRLWMLSDLMANRATAAELRAFTMRPFLLREYDIMAGAETRTELEVVRRQTMTRLVGGVFSGVATFGVYVALGALLVDHRLPLAAAGTAVLALQAARNALALAVTNVNRVYEEGLYFNDYTDFLARAGERMPPVTREATVRAPASIEVRDATLHYAETDAPAVLGANLTVHRGQTIALVGENGSGKTSLARLIAGLYHPDSGTVSWDGTPLSTVDPEDAWRHVAMVSQEYWHWPFTAERNILLGTNDGPRDGTNDGPRDGTNDGPRDGPRDGTNDGTHDEPRDEPGDGLREKTHDGLVEAAARKAGAHDMIAGLPAGYDTLLSRNFAGGQDLSGGQWQRLAAARAFYRDAPVLICDEPSAALDARAEHALFAALRAGAPDRITVLITHRLANVRHADHIYVLHEGRVVEHGAHLDLLAAGGTYAELFALQATGYTAA
ncbi:ATP-binding cassette domain-containing protein [Dactylosporangium sp. NPDC050588]|uniref:ABC transporter ATP-binding protein n=1 Tax=Dactylosporangium sp. NPDC050588 TaxID=3157211 RepID=UPI0033CDFB2F